MQVKSMLLVVWLVALASFSIPTAIAASQDSPKEPQSDAGPDESGSGADVIPGVETHGNGNTYVLLDSTDAGGPTFNAPAYAPMTLAAVASASDDGGELANLGFAFEFYGVAYASVYVNANGNLSFSTINTHPANGDLATQPTVTDPVIAVFWDDLYPGDPTAPGGVGEIRYDTFGAPGNRVFVVEYDDVYRFGPETSGGTFQVRLFETTNHIEFHYFDVQWGAATIDFGAGATVGIRAGAAGTAFLQYLNNSPQIDQFLAIRLWQPTCAGMAVTMVGDRGDDILMGTPGQDIIAGHHGDDAIFGLGSGDRLCGGAGIDTVNGGNGVDIILGGDGGDILGGQGGGDLIYGEGGADRVNGGVGNDTVFGGAGDDDLRGQGDDDTLFGEAGVDQFFGGSGDDTINTGPGGNLGTGKVVNGQGNDDTIIGGTGQDDLDGGPGLDEIHGASGNDLLKGGIGFDRIFGDGGGDTILGGASRDILRGGVSNDVLFGGTGNDDLFGEGGVDALEGQGGTDLCDGGTGSPDTAATCETVLGVP